MTTHTPILINLEDEDDSDFPSTAPTSLPIPVVTNTQNSLGNSDVSAQTRILPIPIPGIGNGNIILNHNALQMPPPTWPHPSRSGGTSTSTSTSQTQMMQTVRTSHVVGGAGGHQMVNTTVNLFVSTPQRTTTASGTHTISNLWNKPAFSSYDDDTSSILCLGEVPPKNQSPFNLSVNHEPNNPNTLTSLNPQSQPTPDLLITPPVSPRDMSSPVRRTSMSSDHGIETIEAVAVAPKIGQKRPPPLDEPVASSSGNKRRIAPIPISQRPHSLIPRTSNPVDRDNPSSSASSSNAVSQSPLEPPVIPKEARIVVQKCPLAEAMLKTNNSAAPALADPSSHITTASSLSAELRKAEAMIMASFEGYMHEKLGKKYDLSKPESMKRTIEMLKDVNKYMQPGRKRAREIFNLIKKIDRDSYDLEIQRIFEKKNLKEKNDKIKKEAEISKLVTELEGYEEKLKELDRTGIFEHETEARSAEKALIIATLCERYAVYKKLVGKDDEVFQMLHKEKFKKIDLSKASLHPQINKAVEEMLDKRRQELFRGGHKKGWDEIYPLFSELKTVVIQTVVKHNIGVTLTDIQMISDDLYHSMVKQSRCGRGKDFINNVDIYIGCSKTKADDLLKADPVHSSKELAIQLDINKATSKSNLQLLYQMFEESLSDSATADTPNEDPEVEEEGEEEEESGDLTESESGEDDEETEEDRMFIDDENATGNNCRNSIPLSPAPSISTMSSYMENHDLVNNSRHPCSSSQGIPGTGATVNASTSSTGTGTGSGPSPGPAHNAATAIISSEYHNRSFPNLMDLSEQYDDISDGGLSLWP